MNNNNKSTYRKSSHILSRIVAFNGDVNEHSQEVWRSIARTVQLLAKFYDFTFQNTHFQVNQQSVDISKKVIYPKGILLTMNK